MASANSNDKLVIFRGDDTGGVFGRRLAFTIEAGDGVDLSGCRAEWIFDGIVKTFAAPIIPGEVREVFYSHNETRCMALGVRYGTFRIIDAAGKVRTLTNTKPVEVTNDAARCYPGASDASFVVHGIGDMKHSEFADLEEKEEMTLKEVGSMVNTLIRKLKGTISAFASILAFGAFADGAITPQTDFGDISPTAKISTVISDAGAVMTETDPTVSAWAKQAKPPEGMTDNALVFTNDTVVTKDGQKTIGAADVGAVPLVEDDFGEKTAVTIGSRNIESAVGPYSLANGDEVSAEGIGTHAEGCLTTAWGRYSHASGVKSKTEIGHSYAYVWNGDENITYASRGLGTFNINPVGGLDGFFIGEQTLYEIMTNKADKATHPTAGNLAALTADGNLSDSGKTVGDFLPRVSDGPVRSTFDIHSPLFMTMDGYIRLGVAGFIYGPFDQIREAGDSPISLRTELDSKADYSMISATNPTFSNAVLAVGLNIDTNSVAVLNEIAQTFGGFPIGAGETATTVGGLLAALAAAIAWLKKNKVGSFESVGGATATVENGVAKLHDFFTESNSLLTETIKANAGGDDEKMRAVFSTFARMDDFTTVSDESDSFDVAITKLSQLLGEDVAA